MIDATNTLTITGGQDVFGADGDKVGSVSGVQGEYMVVSKGFFFPTDYYIPVNAINTVGDDGVYLTVSKDEALNQGWDTMPTTSAYAEEQIIDAGLHLHNPVPSSTAYDADELTADQTRAADAETTRVELAEEELSVHKQVVDRGAVQVDKVVTEQQQTLDVPVTEEQVTVSRRVVDRDVAPGETTFEEGTIEVPVYGEEVAVEKRARVREVLEIDKEQVTGTQQVTDTVRREEAEVRDEAGNVIDTHDRPSR